MTKSDYVIKRHWTRAEMDREGKKPKPDCKEFLESVDEKNRKIQWTVEEHLECNASRKFYEYPHKQNGYRDDNNYKKPCRHLTNWFFARPQDETAFGNSLVPLPKDDLMRNIFVFGELVPNPSKKTKKNEPHKEMKIVITKPKRWTIDKSHDDRGYWVESAVAWYYLKQPESTKKNPKYEKTSMEELFLPNRALLGLFSNIADMLGELHPEEQKNKFPYYARVHKNFSPEESHFQLKATDEELKKDPSLNKEPFDLRFLEAGGAGFVRKHLHKSFKDIPDNCNFMKGLMRLEKKYEEESGKKCDDYNTELKYRSLAKDAEDRSKRHPWGEKINPNDWSININKRYRMQGGDKNIDKECNDSYRRELLKIINSMEKKQTATTTTSTTPVPKREHDEFIDHSRIEIADIGGKETKVIVLDSSDDDDSEVGAHPDHDNNDNNNNNEIRHQSNEDKGNDISFDHAFEGIETMKSSIQKIYSSLRKLHKCTKQLQKQFGSKKVHFLSELNVAHDQLDEFEKTFKDLKLIDHLEEDFNRIEHSSSPRGLDA